MACIDVRDELSARLDGEQPLLADHLLDSHLDQCPECARFAAHSVVLHRSTRIRPAEVVPDLHAQILERVRPIAPRSTSERTVAAISWTRTALTIIGLTMVLVAIPALLFGSTGSSLHLTRELGAWDAAFGAGLLFAAWQPARARGLLPMAGALAGFMVLVATLDVVTGRESLIEEAHHLLAMSGMVALWYLAHLVSPRTALPHRRILSFTQFRGAA